MIRVVSLVDYTEEGMRQLGDLAETVTHVRKTVNGNGGKLEQAWATAGRYDAVAVLNFPTSKPSSAHATRCTRWGSFGPSTCLRSQSSRPWI